LSLTQRLGKRAILGQPPRIFRGATMKPVLQLALDFVDLRRAVKNAKKALAGGVDWLEAGTPLIKSEGLESVGHENHGCGPYRS